MKRTDNDDQLEWIDFIVSSKAILVDRKVNEFRVG